MQANSLQFTAFQRPLPVLSKGSVVIVKDKEWKKKIVLNNIMEYGMNGLVVSHCKSHHKPLLTIPLL